MELLVRRKLVKEENKMKMDLKGKIWRGVMIAGMAGYLGSAGTMIYISETMKPSQNTARAFELERALEANQSPMYVLNHLEHYRQIKNKLEALLQIPEVKEEKAELSGELDVIKYLLLFGLLPSGVISVAGAFGYGAGVRRKHGKLEAEIKKAAEQ